MIYVTSDLHGCALSAFTELLSKAGFSDSDYLFVLGDVVDRGEHGVTLLRWMAEQPNVQLILGNHEAMLLTCDFLFQEVNDDTLAALDLQKIRLVEHWMRNGASPTLSGLRMLLKEEPDVLEGILDYLRDAPLYDTVHAGGSDYILVHSGLGNYSPDKRLSDYAPEELLWARPTLQDRYCQDATVIFGHTPSEFFCEDFRGRAVHGDGWICVDTGAATSGKPMLLRLDDLQEFY